MEWFWKNNRDLLLSLSFGSASFILRYISLNQTPYPNGWDGYYYVMQAHSWLTYGHLQSLDYSLIYPYFTLLSYLVGDYALAFKVGAALLAGALSVATFYLFTHDGEGRWKTILFSSYLIFSPTLTYFISQFPKNALGLIFFLLLLRSIDSKRWRQSFLFAVLSLLTHRMTGGLSLLVLFLVGISRFHWKCIVTGLIAMGIFSLLPGILHISDLQRFEGELSLVPQFAPLSFYNMFESISTWWVAELVIVTLGILFVLLTGIRHWFSKNQSALVRSVLPFILIITLFPFFQFTDGSIGFRFFLIAPIIVMLLSIRLLKINSLFAILSSILFFVTGIFSYKAYDPIKYDPPNQWYDVIVDRLTETYEPDNYPLVIVHKSLAEMIIYKTDFDALNWSPPSGMNSHEILRIVHNLEYFHFTRYLNEEEMTKVTKLLPHYYLTTEANWETLSSRAAEANDANLQRLIREGKNPLEARPTYLKKGKDL
ncbi:MAG: hypothetical protein HRT61_17735 [Ekhidna sp.]|nr:hypothetical protein [Ekhidna sp.]